MRSEHTFPFTFLIFMNQLNPQKAPAQVYGGDSS